MAETPVKDGTEGVTETDINTKGGAKNESQPLSFFIGIGKKLWN